MIYINQNRLSIWLIYLLLFSTVSLAQNTTKVRGIVVDQDDQPLSDVKIQHSVVFAYTTHPTGGFELATLGISSSQPLYLIVSKEGYYLANSFRGNRTYQVSAKERGQPIIIKMQKIPLPTEKKTIAVLPFCDFSKRDTPLIEGAFTSKAAEAISQIDESRMEVVSHIRVMHAMQKNELTADTYCDIDKIGDLAGDLGINIAVMGTYEYKQNGSWGVVCSFIDLSNQSSYQRDLYVSDQDLVYLQEKMYYRLLTQLDIPLNAEDSTIIAGHTTQATTKSRSYEQQLLQSRDVLV